MAEKLSSSSAAVLLERLADMAVEDILSMSSEEIEDEIRAEGEDPKEVAAEMRAILDRAIAEARARED